MGRLGCSKVIIRARCGLQARVIKDESFRVVPWFISTGRLQDKKSTPTMANVMPRSQCGAGNINESYP